AAADNHETLERGFCRPTLVCAQETPVIEATAAPFLAIIQLRRRWPSACTHDCADPLPSGIGPADSGGVAVCYARGSSLFSDEKGPHQTVRPVELGAEPGVDLCAPQRLFRWPKISSEPNESGLQSVPRGELHGQRLLHTNRIGLDLLFLRWG